MSSPPPAVNNNGGSVPGTVAGEPGGVDAAANGDVAQVTAETRLGTPRPQAVSYLSAITLVIYGITFMKAVRLPNSWAATHMTFNYSRGFVRRGLIGEFIRLVGGPKCFHYLPLAIIGIALFVAVVVATVIFVRRSIAVARVDLEYRVAVIVLGASPGAVFFIHEIGYLDYVGLLALLAFILVATTRRRRRYLLFPAVVVAGGALALVHEILVAMFVPAMFFALLCLVVSELRNRHAPVSIWLRWIAGAVIAALVPFASAVLVGAFGTKSPAVIQAMQAATAPLADFPLRGDAFEVLYKPFRQVVLKQMPYHWSFAENRAYLIAGFYAIAPVIAFMVGYGIRVTGRLRASGVVRSVITVTFVAATLGPLFLNLIGWDNGRWNAISVINGFCCIGTMRLFFGSEVAVDRENNLLLVTSGTVAIALGLATSYNNFLFDGFQVRWFPFTEPFRWQ